MNFNIDRSIEILERTPSVLKSLLEGLSDDWIFSNEGEETWSAYDVVGHLIHGELTDWMPRTEIILSEAGSKRFTPFDRFAQFQVGRDKSMAELLTEFEELRKRSIQQLRSKDIAEKNHDATGIHPDFGEVKLSQLLSTWVVHDLNHIAQISRVMAKQYKEAVGPWTVYLRILQS